MVMDNYHIPVMLEEAVDALHIQENGIYVDATFGGGGHSRAILSRLGSKGRLIAFDQDPDAKLNADLLSDERLLFIPRNFRFIQSFLNYFEIGQVDGPPFPTHARINCWKRHSAVHCPPRRSKPY